MMFPGLCLDTLCAPAVKEFVAQVTIVAVMMPAVLHLMLIAAAPLQALSLERGWSSQVALVIVVFTVVLFQTAMSAFMTVPALVGINFGKIQVNKVATLEKLMKSMPLVGLNAVISVVASSAGLLYSANASTLADLSADLPNNSVVMLQSTCFLLITELWFYHVHRLMHENKRLYASIHKIHHTWTAPVALVSTYAHPVEHIVVNLASIMLGPALFGAHPAVAMAYTLLFGVGAAGHHSGYWSDDKGMHDFHHEAFNTNYGNAHVLDYLYGTYGTKTEKQSGVTAAKAE